MSEEDGAWPWYSQEVAITWGYICLSLLSTAAIGSCQFRKKLCNQRRKTNMRVQHKPIHENLNVFSLYSRIECEWYSEVFCNICMPSSLNICSRITAKLGTQGLVPSCSASFPGCCYMASQHHHSNYTLVATHSASSSTTYDIRQV